MKKHAFLIMAHFGIENLCALLQSIDDERNDIYLHLDKKWKLSQADFLTIKNSAKKSQIYFVKRSHLTWGGYSLVKCELKLFDCASKQNYAYYHLLSGQDLVIKNQNDFHEFFDQNQGAEFVEFSMDERWNNQVKNRIRYYYLQTGKNKFLKGLNDLFLKIQKLFCTNRIKNTKMEIAGGSQWVSITHDCVKYLLQNGKLIKKMFGKCYCADEIYKQTLILNSPIKTNLYKFENNASNVLGNSPNLRYIDWSRGEPYTFDASEFESLISSPAMFARKFNVNKDPNLTNMILNHITCPSKKR